MLQWKQTSILIGIQLILDPNLLLFSCNSSVLLLFLFCLKNWVVGLSSDHLRCSCFKREYQRDHPNWSRKRLAGSTMTVPPISQGTTVKICQVMRKIFLIRFLRVILISFHNKTDLERFQPVSKPPPLTEPICKPPNVHFRCDRSRKVFPISLLNNYGNRLLSISCRKHFQTYRK